MSRNTYKLTLPSDPPPEGKKWWWRPLYSSSRTAVWSGGYEIHNYWGCSFCGKRYEGDVPTDGFACQCGARVGEHGSAMYGLVDESYDRRELWA